MARTKWDVIAERKRLKRERSNMQGEQLGLIYRICDLCSGQYCANNYQDRRVRIKKWHGLEICAHCRIYVLPRLKILMDKKIVRWTKKHRPEKK